MAEQLSGRDLAWLERRRAELFGLLSQVGDFRRGALSLRFKLQSSLSVFAGGRFALVVGRSLGFGAILRAFRAAGTRAGGFGRAGGCAD